ncbi:MAG TPA: 3-hydroxyacyl-CoA dehydrogenase NAD-binding domain-containing protein [Bdellovibrionota bacterium]|nr:3-hydroxyacyl-CoA dehydrogenase NAD-binding domain-containing protein [Bdellovibrionota bacterium]
MESTSTQARARSQTSKTTRTDTSRAFELDEAAPRIWRLKFDLPGSRVNKLGQEAMDEFGERVLPELESMAQEKRIDALVLVSGKPGNFVAGADLDMLLAAKDASEAEALSRLGQRLSCRWEDLPFPTVAAVSGAALGGGLELALSCSAIVASDDPATRLGLPEVMLGLIPGMGGCVRLPRKLGLATSLEMILTGKTLSGEKAYKAGLAEALLPRQDFEASVLRWTHANLSALKSGKRIAKLPKLGGMGGPMGSLMEGNFAGRRLILHKAKEGVLEKTHGHYPAPLEALSVLHDTGAAFGDRIRGDAREKALVREARGFGKVSETPVSKNLIRLFFLTEGVKKSNGLPDGRTAEARKVRTAGVLGAGVMGGGIAQLFAEKDLQTRMKDLTSQALQTGLQTAANLFKKQVKRRRINSRQLIQKMNHISPVLDYAGFRSVEFVVEAIVENMDVKKKVLRELEDQVGDDCIVASNTSSLSISEMQKAMKKPERFAGMHFFNPVSKMPLVEVIRGDRSSDEAVSTVYQLAKQLGKTPIVVKDAPGFLVNRLLGPYINEAAYLLAEGAPIPEVDRVLEGFGMPMGPFELIDEVGIDVGAKVAHIFEEAFGERMKACPLPGKALAVGRLGKKNLKGLYRYEDLGGGKLKKELDVEIYTILGVSPRDGAVEPEEIIERCVLPQINEAARCLEEGVVASASEVDLGMIMGTGFPPFRGGLLRYADTLGPRQIVEKLKRLAAAHGPRFEPAPAMLQRAERGALFHDDAGA